MRRLRAGARRDSTRSRQDGCRRRRAVSDDHDDFEQLLLFLKENRGFDFTGYKRTSLRRRVGKRMDVLSIDKPADYVDYLEVHPEAVGLLFDTILINVTA